jgi:hypothetical protein
VQTGGALEVGGLRIVRDAIDGEESMVGVELLEEGIHGGSER